MREVPTSFACEGETLVGILSTPDTPRDAAIVILVGGPQYRVGSHRQFVSLSRHLSQGGFPTLRFDFRGMGDSTGTPRGFEDVEADVRAAINHLLKEVPSVRRIVLWGLCDAASAAMMYAAGDRRVAGLVLANPWLRSSDSYAKTLLLNYYAKRLLSKDFWRKLRTGEMSVGKSTTELLGNVAASARSPGAIPDYRTRVIRGVEHFDGQVLFLLSGNDLTCREFESYASKEMAPALRALGTRVQWARFPSADHTFSDRQAALECSVRTLHWLEASFSALQSKTSSQGVM